MPNTSGRNELDRSIDTLRVDAARERRRSNTRLVWLAFSVVALIVVCDFLAKDSLRNAHTKFDPASYGSQHRQAMRDADLFVAMKVMFGVALGVYVAAFVIVRAWPVVSARRLRARTESAAEMKACANLVATCDEIRRSMNVEAPVDIRLDRTASHPLPSVVSGWSSATLVIPLGLLSLARRDREIVRAMLAHEFAHIRHQDADLYWLPYLYSCVLAWIALPIAVVIVAASLWLGPGSMGAGIFLSNLHLAFVLGAYSALGPLWRSRSQSELLADLVAARYADGIGMLRCIHNFIDLPPRRYRHVHPDPQERSDELLVHLWRIGEVGTTTPLNEMLHMAPGVAAGRGKRREPVIARPGAGASGRYR